MPIGHAADQQAELKSARAGGKKAHGGVGLKHLEFTTAEHIELKEMVHQTDVADADTFGGVGHRAQHRRELDGSAGQCEIHHVQAEFHSGVPVWIFPSASPRAGIRPRPFGH